MKCEELFKKIDELYPEYVKVWEDVCNIESPTNYKAGVDEVCEYFVKMAENRGWNVEILKQDVAGNAACITVNPDAEGEPVCFSTGEEETMARNIVKTIADACFVKGCTCDLEEVSSRPAMEYSEKNYKLLERINQIYVENGLNIMLPAKNRGGSDAAYITRYGITCIDNVGVTGARIHSADEYAVLKSLSRSAKNMGIVAMCI